MKLSKASGQRVWVRSVPQGVAGASNPNVVAAWRLLRTHTI